MNTIRLLASWAVIFIAACLTSAAAAEPTIRVSVDSSGIEGDDGSFSSSLSGDGSVVAFESCATNLVPGDTNGVCDIYVRDVPTGQTSRVSVDSLGDEANGDSFSPAISANGRFVAFESKASNLVPNDTNTLPNPVGEFEAFVHDRVTGQTVRVNVDSSGAEGNAGNLGPGRVSLSADGRFVAFHSRASNLVPGDSNDTTDVFVHDLQNGATERVSVGTGDIEGNWFADVPSISDNGRFVVFRSGSSNLVVNDTNNVCDNNGDSVFTDNCIDVFVHDRQTGETTRVSVSSAGVEGNGQSIPGASGMALSADGRFVAFDSEATNLVDGDTNNRRDFFVHDRQTGSTSRVSVDSNGGQGTVTTFSSADIAISDDGRFVAFEFDSPLVPDDEATDIDVFVHDRQTTETTVVTLDTNENDSRGVGPSISGNGHFVSFWSTADDLVLDDTNGDPDVFLRDRRDADLALSKSSTPDPVAAGGALSYTITLTNGGPGTAYEIKITDTLPAGASVQNAFPGCAESAGVVTCHIDELPAMHQQAITIDVQVDDDIVDATGSATLTNLATVESQATPDPNMANNSASEDTLVLPGCGGMLATIVGTPGNDALVGTAGDDVIATLAGNDQIVSQRGNDIVCGGSGSDSIVGGAGNDHINGGPGDDQIIGGAGNDQIDGGSGNDRIIGGGGTDMCTNGETVLQCE